jgi:hypothetical protein
MKGGLVKVKTRHIWLMLALAILLFLIARAIHTTILK